MCLIIFIGKTRDLGQKFKLSKLLSKEFSTQKQSGHQVTSDLVVFLDRFLVYPFHCDEHRLLGWLFVLVLPFKTAKAAIKRQITKPPIRRRLDGDG